MVEKIEEFSPEIQIQSLANAGAFADSKIDILQSVLSKRVAAKIAVRVWNDGHCLAVEPMIGRLIETRRQQIADESRTLRSTSDVSIVIARKQGVGEAAVRRYDGIHLPTSHEMIRYATRAGKKVLALAKWQIVNEARHKVVG